MTRPLSFSDLPTEILFKILEELDPIHRLLTRNVSRQLRSIIDCLDPAIREVIFFDDKGDVKCFIYSNHDSRKNAIRFQEGCKVDYKIRKNTVEGACHVDLALHFLRPILSNPKLKLESFRLSQAGESIENLDRFLEFFGKNLRIHAKNLEVRVDRSINLDPIMALFQPGTLEFIQIDVTKGYQCDLETFLDTEYFKRAKKVECMNTAALDPVLIDKFLHLSEFDVHVCSLSLENVMKMKENLSKSWENFERCCIASVERLDLDEIAAAVDEEVLHNVYFEWEFPIPDTNHLLYFEFFENSLIILRILG
ncbi:hypothetical protein CAEBREN_06559 [Caenorhabditis brenneri]|uniref:F-box domain-containing protein n=1 Tax=Caenorhabditis brenneri TaxID=135651 RepID=G0MW06_CAEBE|nr:hypothetical protein CAEBREN_06559 [Caenorhabditis brenneri]